MTHAVPTRRSSDLLQVHLDIPANGATEVCFVLGQGDDLDRARELVHTWQDPANIEAAASACAAAWDERLSRVQVTTPDPAFDLMVNRWLPHQSISARVRARAGFYQASGAFGFRDQLQDLPAQRTEPKSDLPSLMRISYAVLTLNNNT